MAVRTASGTTRYTYDAVTGRLASVDDTLAGRTAWTYDLVGRVATVSHPDGAITTYTRDGRGRITRERVARGASVLRDVTYTRDPAGNITRAAEASGRAVDYTYDAGGRIAREVRAGGADDASTDYAYDADGALTRMGARTLAVSQTRLTSDGATAYTWDAAGRMASRTSGARVETFRYDAHGRVVEVTRTGATPARVELAYDHEGLLTRIAADGVGRNLLWDHAGVVAQLVEERDDMGALLARYVQAGGPVAMAVGAGAGSARAIHRDATGSVRVVTDATGAVRESLAYDAWGSATAGASAETRVRHRGEYYVPELGLTYLRARLYDPAIGRFLTPDPIEGTQEAPLSFNPYQFAGNNPVTYGDLTGGFSMASVSVSVAIVSTLASIAIPMIPGAMDVVFGPLLPEVGGFRLNGANAGVSWSQGIADFGIGIDLAFAPGHTVFVVSAVFGLALRSGSSAGLKFSWSGGPSLNADMTTDTAGFLLSFSGSWARRFVDWIRNSSRVRGRNARWTAAVTYLEYAAAFSIKLGEANAHGTANFESTVRISLGFESFGAPSAGDGGGSVGPFVKKTVLKRLNSGAWPTNKFGGSVGFQLQVPVFAMHWYDGVLNDDYWPLDDIF
jgi:RHS repeat-associated protein